MTALLPAHRLQHSGAKAGRRFRHVDAGRLHGLDLVPGAALAAGDDRAGMTHAAARRRGDTGDEADHRFLTLLALQERGRVFLGRAADFADHNNPLGLIVPQEHCQTINKVGAVDRVAADADAGGLAKAGSRSLGHCLIGKRAGAGNNTDLAALVDVARHDADLALTRRDDAGTVRPDQAGVRTGEGALHLDHVEHRNPLGDADREIEAGIDRLDDRIGRERRRHIDDAGGGAGLGDRLGDGVEHRQVEMGGAAFARRDAAHHPGAVGDRLLGMEGALRAGEALADDLGVLVDQHCHGSGLLHRFDNLFGGVRQIVGAEDRQAGLRQYLLAQLHIGAFEADHQRHVKADLLRRRDHALRDHVAAHDAAKDVHQDPFNVGVGEDDLERSGDALLGGAAADIEEVGRRAAIKLDDVHGRHGKAGAVHHAADVAVELDVIEVVLAGLQLRRILLVLVAHLLHVLVAVERVVVEVHLGIERDHVAGTGHHQRVDLDDRAIELDERLVHRRHELHAGRDLIALEAEAERDLARVERLDAGGRIDRHLDDLFRMLGGDLLDLYAAFGRGHDGDARGGAVDQHAEIELAPDVATALHVDALHQLALGAGLVGDEGHADHALGVVAHLVQRLRDLDAAALAPAAGVDLRLYDPDVAAQLLGRLDRLVGGIGNLPRKDADAEFGEQSLRLILVDIHVRASVKATQSAAQ